MQKSEWNDQFIIDNDGIQSVVNVDLKVDFDFDYRDESVEVERVYIRDLNTNFWSRIDDIPRYEVFTEAATRWVHSQAYIDKLVDQARDEGLYSRSNQEAA